MAPNLDENDSCEIIMDAKLQSLSALQKQFSRLVLTLPLATDLVKRVKELDQVVFVSRKNYKMNHFVRFFYIANLCI